jgi:hypothetical protein
LILFLGRPVERISRNDNAWSGRALQDHDLDGFAGYSDAEIETITALLCAKHDAPRDTALGGEEEEGDFKLDDGNHQMIDDPQLLPAITTLRLDALRTLSAGSIE